VTQSYNSVRKFDCCVSAYQYEMESLHLYKMAGIFYNNTPATIDWCQRHGLLAAALLYEKFKVQCTEGALSVAPEGRTSKCPSCRSSYVNSEFP